MGRGLRIAALLASVFMAAAVCGCQSTNKADNRTAAEAWADVEESQAQLDELLEAYKKEEGGKSNAFPDFEARGRAAGVKLALLVRQKCVGAAYAGVESWEDAPCVYETLAATLDPSGNVAQHCRTSNKRQAFIDCMSSGIGLMLLKKSLKQEVTAAEWRDPKTSSDKAWRDFSARSLTMCIAEQAKDPVDCIVEKTGVAFNVAAADLAFCKGQGDARRRMDCIGNAAALATIERSLATSV